MKVENSIEAEITRKRRLDFISKLMYETPGGARFTQDSPVLTNVWLKYAMEPRSPQKLILTVDREHGAGKAAQMLRGMLDQFRSRLDREEAGYSLQTPIGELHGEGKRGRAKISYISGQVSAELYFDEMMRVALPLTPWWQHTYQQLQVIGKREQHSHWVRFPMPLDPPDENHDTTTSHSERYEVLLCGLLNMRVNIDSEMGIDISNLRSKLNLPDMRDRDDTRVKRLKDLPTSLLWLTRIGGVIGRAFSEGYELLDDEDGPGLQLEREFSRRSFSKSIYAGDNDESEKDLEQEASRIKETRQKILDGLLGIYKNWSVEPTPAHPEPCIWRVTRNRPITLAVNKSSLTVKADAARRLFDISCKKITWAVIDSGIDATHPAFLNHSSGNGESRVTKTYDFTKIREMLDYDLISTKGSADDAAKELYEELVETVAQKIQAAKLEPTIRKARGEAKRRLTRLSIRMKNGQDIDWEDLEQMILDEAPDPPVNDHGTHVAGILGADWIDDGADSTLPAKDRPRKMQGMCPDINLYDLRVFRSDGATDEFELLAAVQFLRWLNSRAGYMVVQGANLSLSLIHEVRRFACGKTPICDECDESVALGMVMVAAAGNYGFRANDIDQLTFGDGFSDSSITDPGNAETVITVGATHRKRPFDYGVSYFSSRGPTGDGRNKPDIIAPGEKIKAPTPNEGFEFKDGTSMAAPHVSGAAAMLMARNRELIGKPQRIKQILCESASDLGRERYFQGYGVLDVLRALQSV